MRLLPVMDATLSALAGLALAAGAGSLGDLLDLPVALLAGARLILLPLAASLLYLVTRERMPRQAILVVVGLNLFWAVCSVALLLTGWVEPSATGYAFVGIQALAVAVLHGVQVLSLRRTVLMRIGGAALRAP